MLGVPTNRPKPGRAGCRGNELNPFITVTLAFLAAAFALYLIAPIR